MKKLFLFMLAVMMMTISGCLDARSIDEYGYVLGIGVDPGERALYRISFMIQKEGPSAEENASGGFEVVSAEADTLSEAIMISEVGLPYELNLSRTNMFLISNRLAEETLLSEFLTTDFSAEKIRSNIDILVILGRTDDFMNGLKNDADPNTAKMQATMLEVSRNAGSLPAANLALFMEGIRGGRFDPLVPLGVMDQEIELPAEEGDEPPEPEEPAPELVRDMTECAHGYDSALTALATRSGGLRSAFAGSAVFDGSRMVGVLSTLHTEVLLMARGEFQTGVLKLADGQGRLLSVRLSAEEKPCTELTLIPAPYARVNISLVCSLEMETSAVKGMEPIGKQELEDCLEAFLVRELNAVFSACRDHGADAFGFGKMAAKEFKQISDWESYGWKQHYPELTADFFVTVRLEDRESTSMLE